MSDDSDQPGPPDVLRQYTAEDLQKALVEKTQSVVTSRSTASAEFSGPLPPPHLLEHYESIRQGFSDRIVTMAEGEQAHRHEVEMIAVKGSVAAETRGQIFAFIISLFVIAGSVWLISEGHEIPGTVLAGSTLVGLAYVFITGRRREEEDESYT